MTATPLKSMRIARCRPQHASGAVSAVVAALCRRVSCKPHERPDCSPSPAFSPQPSAFGLSTAGLTLIELLSSLTLLMMMVGLLAIVMNNATDVWHSSRARARLMTQGRAALEVIGQDLRQNVGNTNLPLQVGNDLATYGANNSNNWVQLCRLLSKSGTNQFAMESVRYGVTTNGGHFVLGRWYRRLNIATPPATASASIPTTTDSTNIVVDALAAFMVATNTPACVDIFLALLDPDDARRASAIADPYRSAFVERHAVRMSRRIYQPAQTPGGLP